MAKKLLKFLTNNLGFKILAVGFAFVLWLVVYNIDDPTIRKSFTTSVSIENANAVDKLNKYYEVLDGTNNVTFTVTAKRSVLDKLEDNDFVATADMSRMVVDEENQTGTVAIEISCSRYSNSLQFNGSSRYLKVSLEDLMSKQFVITANAKGEVMSGYALGDVTIDNPNVLKVSGPSSIVSRISTVVATIDVEGMSMNLTDKVVPTLYDEDGNEVDTTKLRLSNTTVTIAAKILSTKEVALNFSTRGAPAGNYRVMGITCDPDKIWIKGTSNVLNPIVSVDIPANVLNISGAVEDITTTVDITEYLPEGVELVDNNQASVTVTVMVKEYITRSFSVPSANITAEGLGDEYELSFVSAGTAQISAVEADLNLLNASQLSGIINVAGLTEGVHTVSLEIPLDESKYAVSSAEVEIRLTKKAAENNGAGEHSSGEEDGGEN